jgi:hypothetical protein
MMGSMSYDLAAMYSRKAAITTFVRLVLLLTAKMFADSHKEVGIQAAIRIVASLVTLPVSPCAIILVGWARGQSITPLHLMRGVPSL